MKRDTWTVREYVRELLLALPTVAPNAFWNYVATQDWFMAIVETAKVPDIALLDVNSFWLLVDKHDHLLRILQHAEAPSQQVSFDDMMTLYDTEENHKKE